MSILSRQLTAEFLRTTNQKIEDLKAIKIFRGEDLLLYFPFRYEDSSRIIPIHLFSIRETNTSRGILNPIKSGKTKTGKSIQKAIFTDEEGTPIECVWFHQPFLTRQWASPSKVMISGKIKFEKGKMTFIAPVIERVRKDTIHTGGIIPMYHETEGISSKWLREKIFPLMNLADEFSDFLPQEIQKEFSFPKKSEAIKIVHFPKDLKSLEKARNMLAFEELFLLQLGALQKKKTWKNQGGAVAIPLDAKLMKEFQETLPFQLTGAQKIALYQILKDVEQPSPMLRMLQGDVGSGKTVVAAMASLPFLQKGYQCVVMSPTEILAKQHFTTFNTLLGNFSTALLIGSLAQKEKKKLQDQISKGEIQLVIGTHALIQELVSFPRLAFAVIDEQHRFGVLQREELVKKSTAHVPHLLMMSATPIPRTLALTIYGDQELSIIDEMPPGRKPIITKIVHPETRHQANLFIDDHIEKGNQVFVICPLIGEVARPAVCSEADREAGCGAKDFETEISFSKFSVSKSAVPIGEVARPAENEKLEAKSVLREYERLKKEDFPHRRLRYLHGKMSTAEKDRIMKEFQEKKIDILVSTSVVEVGIDIPNATIMVIEGAERFGLSQLHQFRGRVGRAGTQSYCFLYTTSKDQHSSRRLRALVNHTDGFKLAEIDLQIRGPGEVYGLKQSGIPDLKMASLMDSRTIALARKKAAEILEKDPELISFPELKQKSESMVAFLKA